MPGCKKGRRSGEIVSYKKYISLNIFIIILSFSLLFIILLGLFLFDDGFNFLPYWILCPLTVYRTTSPAATAAANGRERVSQTDKMRIMSYFPYFTPIFLFE